MGPDGLRDVASQCHAKAIYAAERISAIPGFEMVYDGEFFHEFVTRCPCNSSRVIGDLDERGILGGMPIVLKSGGDCLLWCVTEMNTSNEIDELAAVLKGAAGR